MCVCVCIVFFKALMIKLSYQSTNHQCPITQISQSCSKPLLLPFNSIQWKPSFVCQVPEGFEMCVRLMLPGEIALVTCPPDYAYDKFPRLLSKIEFTFFDSYCFAKKCIYSNADWECDFCFYPQFIISVFFFLPLQILWPTFSLHYQAS